MHALVAVDEHEHPGELQPLHQHVDHQRLVGGGAADHHLPQLRRQPELPGAAGSSFHVRAHDLPGRHHAPEELRLEQVELLQLLGVVAQGGREEQLLMGRE